jgi:hypothetical protein
MAQAAKKIILTTEKIVSEQEIQKDIDLAIIPGFKVEAVVEIPQGAKPASCYPFYDYCAEQVKEYLSIKNKTELNNYLQQQT